MSQKTPNRLAGVSVAEALRRAVALLQENRPAEAAELCQAILRKAPRNFDALQLLGIALAQRGGHKGAVAAFRQALEIRPGSAALHNNLGNALRQLSRYEEARTSLENALELSPDFPDALNNLGIVLTCLNHRDEAIGCFRRTLELSPALADAHHNLGTVLSDQERYEEAAACFSRALELHPRYPEAYLSLGRALGKVKHCEEAIASYENALKLRPGYAAAILGIAMERRQICDWRNFAAATRELRSWAGSDREPIQPFFFLTVSDDPGEQLQCARRFAQKAFGHLAPLPPLEASDAAGTGPIRIAYISNSYHQHAMSLLAAELFERHDRARFEIHAFSVGPSKQDPMRARLMAAFDGFHDVRDRSDREVAALIRELRCPIAVDLMGYELDSRLGILAYRPAPIQVAYLQHPGPMGADFIDYALVDDFVAPADQQPFYPERLVALPNCYQVNPTVREIAATAPSRRDCGLPEQGFVFCCFNNSKKFTPELFDLWMRILAEAPDSVLWLYKDSDAAARNLRREAEARGVSADRLIFAPHADPPEHLARHRHADLFLDTFPYNAHTTASDALRAGLPVLTRAGRGFASRVAGSLLTAAGLPELITDSPEDYQALALGLCRDRRLLAGYREHLAVDGKSSALFDCERFTRNLEGAYATMVGRWTAGRPRAPLTVSDVGPSRQRPS